MCCPTYLIFSCVRTRSGATATVTLQWYVFPPEHRSLVKCVSSTREHISLRICVFWLRKHSPLGTGAHDYVRLISLISGVNPLSNRLNRTAGFELKGSYFLESRKSPWKKRGDEGEIRSLSSHRFPFHHTLFFPILQPMGSGYNETKVNDNISLSGRKQ